MADTTNDAASTMIATGAVRSWTSAPARPGPATCAAESLSCSRLFAWVSWSRSTIRGTNDW